MQKLLIVYYYQRNFLTICPDVESSAIFGRMGIKNTGVLKSFDVIHSPLGWSNLDPKLAVEPGTEVVAGSLSCDVTKVILI